MKITTLTLVMLGAAFTSPAQTTFHADLTSPQSPGVRGAAAFVLEELTVRFTISLTLENVVPTTAQLVGQNSTFVFDLGPPSIAVHSPGPWPNGYDGSTAFTGTFQLPEGLREDFVNGQTRLELLGSRVGDFSGPVLPASFPLIAGFSRQGSTMQIRFMAEPPYRYTLERSASLEMNKSVGVTNVSALSQAFEVVVSDPGAAQMQFYRVRRELASPQ